MPGQFRPICIGGQYSPARRAGSVFLLQQSQKVLFRQNGAGQAILDATHPTALRMDIPELANVLALEGQLLVVTVDGRVARLDAQGSLSYEASMSIG
ncbi:hypothetical protein [Pseudomonas baetica]|uniref:hypothetical protein n=1 Tax=Pseudomonas baetica TaxID=674054 RepID=UPI001FC99E00|nr:hypothetical protein [Pseudomonas baetica]